jgi:hypothetical protein
VRADDHQPAPGAREGYLSSRHPFVVIASEFVVGDDISCFFQPFERGDIRPQDILVERVWMEPGSIITLPLDPRFS